MAQHWSSHDLAKCSARPRTLCNILEKIPHTRAGDVHDPQTEPPGQRTSAYGYSYLPTYKYDIHLPKESHPVTQKPSDAMIAARIQEQTGHDRPETSKESASDMRRQKALHITPAGRGTQPRQLPLLTGSIAAFFSGAVLPTPSLLCLVTAVNGVLQSRVVAARAHSLVLLVD